jgi:TRAP-type C4-dicarboxylate transport system substrate-binding protein
MSLAVAASLLAACGAGRSDKAGGVTAPTVLRLAISDGAYTDPGDVPKFFADEVRRLSHGRMRVDVRVAAAGLAAPDAEQRVARMVMDGRYDLGLVGARAWDELGVTTFEALQAPFLVTDQSLLKAVIGSPLAARMLAGLRSQDVVGLALLPGTLRHPVGYDQPLSTLADYRGKRIRVQVSRVGDAVIAALGARPLHLGWSQVGPLVLRHELDGQEMPFATAPDHAWITANVTFFPKALTLFGTTKGYARLSGEQRQIVRTAAAHAVRHALSAMESEASQAGHFCSRGHVVHAPTADVAALERATRPVYAQLERDPQISSLIGGIRQIKGRTAPDPAPDVPASCSPRPSASTVGGERDPSFLDGTYRWHITRAGAIKRGGDPRDPDIGGLGGMTLKAGRWISESGKDSGTFKIVGRRIVFDWPQVGSVLTFTFERRDDGELSLEPVLPMDVGDQVVWSSAPWRRVGPPIRKVP